MPSPLTFYTPHALLAEGWYEDVIFTTDISGAIASIAFGPPPNGAERLRGAVIPGMADVHSHAFQRAMAGLAEHGGKWQVAVGKQDAAPPDSFWSWREVMYHFLRTLTPEMVQAIAAQCYVEMLKGGYTAVGEFHYLHHQGDGTPYANPAEMSERILAAAEEAGIALTLLPTLYAHGNFGGHPPTAGQTRFLNTAERYLDLLARLERRGARLGVAFHSLRAVSPEMMREVLAATSLYTQVYTSVHIHAAEQVKEVEDCLAWSSQRPVAWLLDHMPVDARWCLIHATHLDEDETSRLAASRAVACLCPTTEGNLGDGFFPAESFLKAGGRFALGTDSHVTLNTAEEIRLLEYAQRLQTRRRNVLCTPPGSTGYTLYTSASRGGAHALGLKAGMLAPGHRADMVELDTEHPSLLGRKGDALLDAYIFAPGEGKIRSVIVGGAYAVKEGRHPREEVVYKRYRAAISANVLAVS